MSTNINTSISQKEIFDDDVTVMGYEIKIVLVFKYIAAILSLLGSLFIIICYISLTYLVKIKPKEEIEENNKEINNQNNNTNNKENNDCEKSATNKSQDKNKYKGLKMGYGHNLIFYLAISDFFLSIASFVKSSGFDSGIISSTCVFQGIMINFTELNSICWTSIIALSVYLSTKKNAIQLIEKFYIFYFLFAYGFPLLLTILPLFSNSYGPAGAWCWMNTKNHENVSAWIWSLIIYIFIWGNIIFNIIAIIKSLRYFKIRTFEVEEKNNEEADFLKNFCIVLKFFPIILVICWLPATINRIYLFASHKENTGLYATQAFFSNLTGFLNCTVYSYYYKTLIKLFCCKKKQEPSHELEMSNIADIEYSKHLATEKNSANGSPTVGPKNNKNEINFQYEFNNENVIKEEDENSSSNNPPEVDLKV